MGTAILAAATQAAYVTVFYTNIFNTICLIFRTFYNDIRLPMDVIFPYRVLLLYLQDLQYSSAHIGTNPAPSATLCDAICDIEVP